MIPEIEIIGRILLAAVIGGLIGIEREVNNRPAGLRTHVLVTLGATLIMLISIDGFDTLKTSGEADPARLAAQVVSGIGFLGAGTIMRTGANISGLTTAASLWVSAGIGLGIGAGYYLGTIFTAVIVLLTLMSLRILERKVLRRKYKNIEVVVTNRPGIIGQIGVVFGNHHISIKDIAILDNDYRDDEEGGLMEVRFAVKIPSSYDTYNLYKEIYDIPGIISITYQGEIIRYKNRSNSHNTLFDRDDK
jgi:putative Mg2+ transporter-C (MgtC) family protein